MLSAGLTCWQTSITASCSKCPAKLPWQEQASHSISGCVGWAVPGAKKCSKATCKPTALRRLRREVQCHTYIMLLNVTATAMGNLHNGQPLMSSLQGMLCVASRQQAGDAAADNMGQSLQ